jgi:hypothetical protein
MKRLGPELKMPDLKNLKAPDFLADVYYDLRERRLLPLVALVVVAIATVPFLLGGDVEEPAPPPALGAGAVEEAEEAASTRLNVVEATPGLRDYRKRLRGRSPSDPFVQKYTGLPEAAKLKIVDVAPAGGSSGGGSTEVSVEVEDGETEVEVTEEPGSEGPSKRGGGSGKARSEEGLKPGRLYGFRPDVRFGVAGSGELTVHEELPLGSLLPKGNPVVLFVGVTQNGKRALFSVTPEVTLVRGNGDCIGGVRSCRILSMRVGRAVTLLTDTPGRSFRLKVVGIEFVELDLPPREQRASGSGAGEPRTAWARGLAQNFSK